MDTAVTEPSLGRALGAIADTAVGQVHDLAVARLDHWAGLLHQQLTATPAPSDSASGPVRDLHPVLIGAVAGATLGWLFARWHRDS